MKNLILFGFNQMIRIFIFLGPIIKRSGLGWLRLKGWQIR